MITVHHLGLSQSERIVWLCEELGVPYVLDRHDRDATTRLAPASYKALHPQGTAPVITDGAVVMAESGAIMDYIIAKYGDGRLTLSPADPAYADYIYWLHFGNGSMMPAVMMDLVIARMAADPDGPAARSMRSRAERAFQQVEARLGAADYLAGDVFTAADIMMVFPLTTMRAFAPRDLAPYPNIRNYLRRIGARPAYHRAMAKGDPDLAPMLD